LSSTFVGRTILEDLDNQKDNENYKCMVEDALNLKFALNKIKMEKLRAKAAAGGATVSTTAKNATIKALKMQNKALVTEQQKLHEKIKLLEDTITKQNTDISKLKEGNVKKHQTMDALKKDLDIRTKELFASIWDALPEPEKIGPRVIPLHDRMHYTERANYKFSNERTKAKFQEDTIEKWRNKREKKRKTQTPNASHMSLKRARGDENEERVKRMKAHERRKYNDDFTVISSRVTGMTTATTDNKRKIQTPTIVGQSKRPKVEKEEKEKVHVCDKCDGCGRTTRAECATDQGLPVYVKQII
jgi:uncharacterized coiled-coil protein SlyX